MFRSKDIFIDLTKLSKMTLSSNGLFLTVCDLTFAAFFNEKPLFITGQKPKAAKLIEKSLPLINKGYVDFCIGMIPDRRQDAQISRSGLQYMIDEFKDDDKTYDKLKPIFDAPGVKWIEKEIEAYTGIPNDYIDDMEMDLSQIPSSHFWWFFVDENNDDEEDVE